MPPEIIWLIVALVLLGLESVTFQLVCIWFAIGAMITMLVCCIVPIDLTTQLLVFVVSSGLLLGFTRRLVKNFLSKKNEKTNIDSLIGKTAIIDENVDNLVGSGSLKLEGKVWTVRSTDDTPIASGAVVEVLEIRGVKLIVKEVAAVRVGE